MFLPGLQAKRDRLVDLRELKAWGLRGRRGKGERGETKKRNSLPKFWENKKGMYNQIRHCMLLRIHFSAKNTLLFISQSELPLTSDTNLHFSFWVSLGGQSTCPPSLSINLASLYKQRQQISSLYLLSSLSHSYLVAELPQHGMLCMSIPAAKHHATLAEAFWEKKKNKSGQHKRYQFITGSFGYSSWKNG